MKTAAGVTYAYDGDGRRVQKSSGKLYWYGMGSDPIMETDAAGNNPVEYIFFGGMRIARRDSPGNVSYYFADHLGTARVVTNATGTILDDSDFYPFGGERPVLSSSGNPYKFTGKERDSESGLDDFDARYYSSALGRFTSPDWSAAPTPVPYADLSDPQTLDLYSYVQNRPLMKSDVDGHCEVFCASVVAAVVGYLAYKAGQLYYHSQELKGVKESYEAETKLLYQVAINPNGQAESQIDLNKLAHSIQSDEAKLAVVGSQVASDAVALANGAASAGRSAVSEGPPSNSGGVEAEKAIGAGLKVGTKAVKEFIKATEEKPGQRNQQPSGSSTKPITPPPPEEDKTNPPAQTLPSGVKYKGKLGNKKNQ